MIEKDNAYRFILAGLICLFAIFSTSVSMGQEGQSYNDKTLKKESIEDLSEMAQYDKRVKKLSPKKINWDERKENKPIRRVDFGASQALTYFLYVVIALLVAYILYVIFANVKIDKKVHVKPGAPKEEIEDIEVIDSDSGLSDALATGDYRKAVRMLFIKLLQQLVEEKSINWKPEKTNRHYLNEMRDHSKFRQFDNLVLAYEGIWYGSQEIDKLYFDYLRQDFEKFYSEKKIEVDGQ